MITDHEKKTLSRPIRIYTILHHNVCSMASCLLRGSVNHFILISHHNRWTNAGSIA